MTTGLRRGRSSKISTSPLGSRLRTALRLLTGLMLIVCGLVFGFIGHMHVRWHLVNAFSDPRPLAVGGNFAKFTLLVLTYSERLPLLHTFVRHYSRCASVLEILVVWNKGEVPRPGDFESQVPLRIRAEARNSLNNRFSPDARLRTRAVLSLDDDIYMTCEDLERGFAEWRRHPHALVGFHPRLATGSPLRYTPEHVAVARNSYNLILTGSAFMDAQEYFPLYQRASAGAAMVDDLFNCEDVLMNFVTANATRGSTAVVFVRPRLRIDVSFTSGVPRLSGKTKAHQTKRDICLDAFSREFGDVLVTSTPEWGVRGPPICSLSCLVGCLFW